MEKIMNQIWVVMTTILAILCTVLVGGQIYLADKIQLWMIPAVCLPFITYILVYQAIKDAKQ